MKRPNPQQALAWGIRAGYLAIVVYILAAAASFYHPQFGFTSLAVFGSKFDERATPRLKAVPRYVEPDSWGYDGQFYAQLALYPSANDPALFAALDSPAYRSRRILFAWTAWGLGLGQPDWIVQAYSIQNVLFWLAFALLLLRWFPPDHWQNLLRYTACLLSIGYVSSFRHALTDGPALTLVCFGIYLVERRRATGGALAIGLATLGKETSLLAAAALAERIVPRDPATWIRPTLLGLLAALPFALWMGYLIFAVDFPGQIESGLGAFDLPFAGWLNELVEAIKNGGERSFDRAFWIKIAVLTSLAVQAGWILLRPQLDQPWWRVGAAYAALTAILGTAVWEGYIGAAPRAVLPLTVAFNVLLPRTLRHVPLLILGNLSVLTSFEALRAPNLSGGHHIAGQVHLALDSGTHVYHGLVAQPDWHPFEGDADSYRRWSPGSSSFAFTNPQPQPVAARLRFKVRSLSERRLELLHNGQPIQTWSVPSGYTEPIEAAFVLPPGPNTFTFASPQPPDRLEPDPRELSFALLDYVLELDGLID